MIKDLFYGPYLYDLVLKDLGGNFVLHVSPSAVVGVPADTLIQMQVRFIRYYSVCGTCFLTFW